MAIQLILGAISLAGAPALFAVMALFESQRLYRYWRHGVRAEAEVIGEEIHRRTIYPVVRFHDHQGISRQFRSLIGRRNNRCSPPEKVTVIYLPHRPSVAEMFSGFHPYKHLFWTLVALAVSTVLAVWWLPMFLSQS